jgi:hypothetical protein
VRERQCAFRHGNDLIRARYSIRFRAIRSGRDTGNVHGARATRLRYIRNGNAIATGSVRAIEYGEYFLLSKINIRYGARSRAQVSPQLIQLASIGNLVIGPFIHGIRIGTFLE